MCIKKKQAVPPFKMYYFTNLNKCWSQAIWISEYCITCRWSVYSRGECRVPYSWLFSRALYFTNLLSLASSRMQFSRIFAMDSISVILLKYFKVLNFTNLVCTTKFLKYKSLENFQLYGTLYQYNKSIVGQ